jgi:hypothetical protein
MIKVAGGCCFAAAVLRNFRFARYTTTTPI